MPAARPPCSEPIVLSVDSFKSRVTQCVSFTVKAEELGSQGQLSNSEVADLFEMSFLKIYCEFEALLESVTINYLLGSCAANGRKPDRYFLPKDQAHAKELILLDKRFVQFGDTNWVRSFSICVFKDGYPIAVALNASNKLPQFRDLRNCIAHRTDETYERFRTFVAQEIGVIPPHVLRPGDLLRETEPRGRHPKVFLARYAEAFVKVSECLVTPP